MVRHRHRREPVRHHEDAIDRPARRALQGDAAGGVERASEIGAPQVGRAVRNGAAHAEDGLRRERRRDRAEIEFGVNGVAGGGVGELEVEHRAQRHRIADAAEPDPRRRGGAQRRPGIG